MIEWIQANTKVLLTVVFCVLVFYMTLFLQGWRAYRKRQQVKGRRAIVPPRAPSGQHYKLADIAIYEVAGQQEPEVALYFYTEEKFIVSCHIMEAMYKLLKNEGFYDYDTFDSFMETVSHFIMLRDKRNKQLADKLRKTAKRKR
jgi:hypothetical protein